MFSCEVSHRAEWKKLIVETEGKGGGKDALKVGQCLKCAMSTGTTGCLFPLLDRNGGRKLTAFVGSGVTSGTTDAGLPTGASSIKVYHWNRLRTGHCRLNSHLKRIGVKTSAQCPCGEADQTPEHYLQSCSLHQQARQQIWPTCVSLKTKLWGSAEDLLLTFRYAALTGERI